MNRTCLAALLLAASAAAAQDGTNAPSRDQPTSSSSTFYEGNHFGLQVDAGIPAGATLGIVARPWSFLRVNAGVGYDVIAFGVKGGVTIIPFHWSVVPTIGLEAGHFFSGDATNLIDVTDPTLKVLLRDVGYDYFSADIGVEFGSQRSFVFYIRGGLAQIWAGVHNVQQAIDASNPGMQIRSSGASASALIPTGRLGIVWYFF